MTQGAVGETLQKGQQKERETGGNKKMPKN